MHLSPRWSKVLHDLTSHKARTALVVLSIAVGVLSIAVVMTGRQVLLREFDVDFESSVPPSAEFYTSGFDESLVDRVADRSDVRAAEGRRRVVVRYSTDTVADDESTVGWKTMRLWAVPDFGRGGVQKFVREEGTAWPPQAGEIVLEKSALQLEEFSVGETITVETSAGKRVDLRIVGFAHDINAVPAQFQNAVVGFMSMDTLEMLGEPEQYNHLSVVLDPTLTRSAASRIAADIRDTQLAAAGVTTYNVVVPKPGSHFLGDIFKALTLLLLAIGVMALLLSGFLVITTVSAIMTQQVRQVGIMKAIGGRRTQIAWMYLLLVLAYGAVAVVIGIAGGNILARMLIDYAKGVLNFRVVDYAAPAWVIALDVAVGLLVPVLAAVVPVHQGTTLPVARALNATGVSVSFGHGLVDRALGLIRGLPRPIALSLRNTFLRKGRLALTLTTLVLASAVVMSVLSARSSMLQTVDDMGAWWNYDAQVFMSSLQPRAELEREAKKIEGVTAVETWLETGASLKRPDGTENEELTVLGVPGDTRFITPELVEGRWLTADDEDAVVVNTDVIKDEPYLGVGDTITLTTGGNEKEWKIVGVVTGQLMGSVIFAEREALDTAIGAGGGVSRLLVQTSDHSADAQERTANDLERRLDDASIPISGSQTQSAQKTTIANELGILVTFLVIMASLLAAVGVIGLTGTMTINVLESTREIGVMRSIGASHGSIFQIFITEGMVVAIMAWALGAVLSWPLSVWLVDALGTAMSLPLSYRFSYAGVGLWFGTVIVIAVFASLLPAWRASQVSIRDAISYE